MIRTTALTDQLDAVFGEAPGGRRTHPAAASATGPVLVRRSASTGPIRRPVRRGAAMAPATCRGAHRLDGTGSLDRILHRADARRVAAIT